MRSVAFCLFAVAAAQSATRSVTVLVNFEKPHSDTSMTALRQELSTLLKPAGIDVNVMLKSEMPVSPQFSELVVFDMKGSCSMKPTMPMDFQAADPDGPQPLAMTYTSDGQILHFGEVECDRIRRCLQEVMGAGGPEKHQAQYGTALGIVVAHEIYHMIAGVKKHTKNGLTKESLSAHELLDGDLTIPGAVSASLRR